MRRHGWARKIFCGSLAAGVLWWSSETAAQPPARLVPGWIIGQHQGGGKAEQYLIRGFDADPGTDIALFVDGVPVNMRSHEDHRHPPQSRLLPRTEIFATYWFLNLASELVFVGDEGTTEASGRSRREGTEFGAKVRILDWLTFTGNFTYTTKAELVDTRQAIPLAPIWTARADLTARLPWGLASSLEMRSLGDRPADPDRTSIAKGYTLFNWTTRYRYRDLEAFLSVENLTNTHWRESQFSFTSRLPGEPAAGVSDIHFTPGAPRSFLGGIAVHF